ncbi:MAG: aldolase/citrate lyase family protein [Pigmentiphaga sp.]|uniref:aldolase/citrate lyase family protein n=1 Tax=Pigmentiphaga sp. TaxID=1977564 RepID=UPI003B55FDAD
MNLPENAFKRALIDRRRLIGLWAAMADPYSLEICAQAGFDWLLLDGEHGPNDLRSVLAQLQALAAYPPAPVVRVPEGDAVLLKQYLEIGVQNFLVPMVESAEQARAIVAATRYPPHGTRGVGSSIARSSRWATYADYLYAANGQICVLAQVETAAGVDRVAQIAAVDGVDGIFIGPADLAASMGHLGEPGHPEVRAAIDRARRGALSHDKAVGTLATDSALIRQHLEQGASVVAVGADTALLARATRELAAAWINPA